MRTPTHRVHSLAVGSTVVLTLLATPASGQWTKVPEPVLPRTADGKPNLSGPAPRLPDGRPDLTGIWRPNDNTFVRDIAAGLKPDDVPYQPWAKALFDARKDGSYSSEDPDAHCLPQGVPKINSVQYPWKLIQTPNSIVIIYETFNYWRQIFTDGRQMHPDANPTWMGYSTGQWEGETFVIHTRGFNGMAWLDQLGRPTTDRLHVIERFRRPDFGRLSIEITIDDPGAYTKPWTVSQQVYLRPEWEPFEFICNENNRDLQRMPGTHVVIPNVERARALFPSQTGADKR
jgi:hypothetical protein